MYAPPVSEGSMSPYSCVAQSTCSLESLTLRAHPEDVDDVGRLTLGLGRLALRHPRDRAAEVVQVDLRTGRGRALVGVHQRVDRVVVELGARTPAFM